MAEETEERHPLGRVTRMCVGAGLALFVLLALGSYFPWPEGFVGTLKADALITTFYTALAAAAVAGVELICRRHVWPGLSLLAAVALVLLAWFSGVTF
ncbi:MAG: hypothetical protein IH851_07755 [Armatimonadetes bacterium]|nr:hypothetical protein [Armatimonadota bacterium]